MFPVSGEFPNKATELILFEDGSTSTNGRNYVDYHLAEM